ncbi:MAG: hypothetical protein KIT33_13055 [Candidatus Kapabacteria bacterium]|nr:hypothetical protein [Ignavibacteriota bacterium]MCW5885891.1 hypothetical protein [Candidatus Kapabacteria bacterium]
MKGKYIVWIVLLVIALMSGIAFFMQSKTSSKVSPQIIEQLIEPYKQLLQSGNFEEAYYSLTSIDYKVDNTFAKYLAAQDSNKAVYGELVDLKPVSGVFLKETTQGNKIIFKATFAYIGSKSSQRIVIDAIKENDEFKLFKTYNSYVSIGGLVPVIY